MVIRTAEVPSKKKLRKWWDCKELAGGPWIDPAVEICGKVKGSV